MRCVLGGLGPLAVGFLTEQADGDIQVGLMLVPVAYLASSAVFYLAEQLFEAQAERQGGDLSVVSQAPRGSS